jgi:hypothetical protein
MSLLFDMPPYRDAHIKNKSACSFLGILKYFWYDRIIAL